MKTLPTSLLVLALASALLAGVAAADSSLQLPSESVWEGRYLCAQGSTGLTLTVRPVGGDVVTAIFAFGPTPENPDVPRGSYTMRGTLSAGSHTVHLVPERWLAQPPGYVMVGMTGTFDVARGVMQGSIDHPSCGPFQLRRVR